MRPQYVASKSAFSALNIFLILLSFLVFLSPVFLVFPLIQVYKIVAAKKTVIEFYDNRIVLKKGVFTRSERQTVFLGVYSVSVRQGVLGMIFNFGDVVVDCPGRKWDISTENLSNPNGLKHYLESKISGANVHKVVVD